MFKSTTFVKHLIGVVQEWLNWLAWKASMRQKRIPSSNLGHSASSKARNFIIGSFGLLFTSDWLHPMHCYVMAQCH